MNDGMCTLTATMVLASMFISIATIESRIIVINIGFDRVDPLCIGMVHGLAGSAALMLLILASTKEIRVGLLSILEFGVGSIIGMMLIGLTISLPVSRSISERFFMAVQTVASMASVVVGGWMLARLTVLTRALVERSVPVVLIVEHG